MGLKSSFKKILGNPLNPLQALGFNTLNKVFNPASLVWDWLLKVPKPPQSLQAGGQQYNPDLQVNSARIGDVKPKVIGRARIYPAYCSMPFKQFTAQQTQYLFYLHLSTGPVSVLATNVGDTSLLSFSGVDQEILLPGEDMTLILPNVYTCPEVEGVEMLGGLLSPQKPSDGSGRVTVKVFTNDTVVFSNSASTISATEDALFADFIVGDLIGVYDSNLNEDFDYTITAISDDFKTLTVTPAPVDEVEPESGYFVRQRWAGPFPACSAGAKVSKIALDFAFAALRDEDEPDNIRSVDIVVQYREIDDVGVPVGSGAWTTADDGETHPDASVRFSDDINRARRYTPEFELSGSMRPEVRTWRKTYEQADSEDPSSALSWMGLKGYIDALPADEPASDAESSRMALTVIASGGLAQASTQKINCLVQAQTATYVESDGWSDPQDTSNPSWWTVNWLVTESNGKVGYANLDIPAFVEFASHCDDNNITFNGYFDQKVDYKEGADTIARVGRAKVIKDDLTGLYTIYRDAPADPVLIFADRENCTVGRDGIRLADANTVTGIQVLFTDPVFWRDREGPLVGSSVDPRKTRFTGCTTWGGAWIEANYEFRDLIYRNHTLSIDTEMEGLIPLHGQRVLVCSAVKGWGQPGRVQAQQLDDPLRLTLDPPPAFTPGQDHYLYLQNEDGTPTDAIPCVAGIAEGQVVLDSLPDGFVLRMGARWKTIFAFGHDGDGDEIDPDAPRIAIVNKRKVNGRHKARLDLVFDHPFVHEDPGPAPDDPYALGGEIPDLTVNDLVAEQDVDGDFLTDPEGSILADPEGDFLLEPGGGGGGVVVNASWSATPGASLYTMRWKYVGDPGWHSGFSGVGTSTTFAVPHNGTVQVRVKASSTTNFGPEASTTVEIDAYP